jgi:biopolymer transport protein ExbD
MRKFASKPEEAEINLTPLLDIVFIMLIFFIVTATFIKESGLDINKPDSDQPPPPEEEKKKNILIQIDGNNRIFINLRRVDIAQVTANIARLHAENPQGIVVIQPDGDSQTGLLVEIYDAALQVADDIQIAIAEPT